MTFDELQLIEPLLRAVRAEGYTEPSPIQQQAIPHVLAGRDLLGCAQTGTGKTAAFALPILQRLMATMSNAPGMPFPDGTPGNSTAAPNGNQNSNQYQGRQNRDGRDGRGRRPVIHLRALILSPTRELTVQIGESFETYGRYTPIRQITVFGGVNQNPQIDRLQRGADVLIATPGRLLDLMNQGYVKLDRIETLVLDESDRMLDMGFIRDVRRIIATLPTERQTLLFSATMPEEIQSLADSILKDPVRVEVTPVASTVDTIDQSVFFVEKNDKPALLEHVLRDPSVKRVLVFARTKHGADRVVENLRHAGVFAQAIHGNKSQAARQQALLGFKTGRTRVLVATDIAARGIDVDGITHVINYDLPNEPDSYVHRIGRTARAGASGIAYSFCEHNERASLVDIERLIRLHIPRTDENPFESPFGPPPLTDLNRRGRQAPQNNFNSGNRSRSNGPSRSRGPQRQQRPQGSPHLERVN